jgi:hypothetical protein
MKRYIYKQLFQEFPDFSQLEQLPNVVGTEESIARLDFLKWFTNQIEEMKLGDEGWELVTSVVVNDLGTNGGIVHTFKRPYT